MTFLSDAEKSEIRGRLSSLRFLAVKFAGRHGEMGASPQKARLVYDEIAREIRETMNWAADQAKKVGPQAECALCKWIDGANLSAEYAAFRRSGPLDHHTYQKNCTARRKA